MTAEIDAGQQLAQSYDSVEEATAALEKYAHHFEMTSEMPSAYQFFLDNHQVVEIQKTLFAIALKPNSSPVTFTEN